MIYLIICSLIIELVQAVNPAVNKMQDEECEEQFNEAAKELKLKMNNEDIDDKLELKFDTRTLKKLSNIIDLAIWVGMICWQGNNKLKQKLGKKQDVDQFQICNCCGLLLQNETLPFTTRLKDLNLGIGVTIFFNDFIYFTVLYFAMFLIYSTYAIGTNSRSFLQDREQTESYLCTPSKGCGLSDIGAGSKVLIQNSHKNTMSMIQSWIGVAFVILWGLANIAKTHFQQKLIVDVQTKRVSASDFTLMFKNFPKRHLGSTKSETLKQVQKIFDLYYEHEKTKGQCPYPYQVVSVNVAAPLYFRKYENAQLQQRIKDELHNKQKIFRTWVRQRKYNDKFPLTYEQRNKRYNEYNNFYCDTFEKEIFPKIEPEQLNTIFVTMRHSKARQEIQQNNKPISMLKFWKAFNESEFPVSDVVISKAPEPQQIKWQNIGFPSGQRARRRVYAWLATIALIGVSLAINIGISFIKQKSTAMSISISLVVTLINLGIQIAMIYFTSLEHQYITSYEQSSIALKIGVGQLTNSIVVPIVVTIISGKSWLRSNGLVDDVFFIALFNLLVPITTLIDPFQHWLRFIRWWYSDPDRRLQLFGQKELNKFYGNYIFDIGYEYAFLIKTCIFTAFFVCMQPIIALFAPLALLFYYVSVRHNLFYHFQRPTYHYETTNNSVDLILLFSPLAFALGCLLVNNINTEVQLEPTTNGTLIVTIITIIISCVFLIIVPFRIFYCCIPKPQIQNKDYLVKKMLIYTDYDRANPVTKVNAIAQFENYLRKLQQQVGLDHEASLVKLHVSTFQRRSVLKPQNTLTHSIIRMSAIQKHSQIRLSQIEYIPDSKIMPHVPKQKSFIFGQKSRHSFSVSHEGARTSKQLPAKLPNIQLTKINSKDQGFQGAKSILSQYVIQQEQSDIRVKPIQAKEQNNDDQDSKIASQIYIDSLIKENTSSNEIQGPDFSMLQNNSKLKKNSSHSQQIK